MNLKVISQIIRVHPRHTNFAHVFSPLGQTMQQFFWQEDMQSVVHFIQECLCILLPATVAASVVDDASNQP